MSSCALKSTAKMRSVRPIAIRGAITVDKNDAEEIKAASLRLLQEILEHNPIDPKDIIMLFITMTSDLTAYNAASAIRFGLKWNDIPFFASQEPNIDKALPRCIRVLIQVQSELSRDQINHIYLEEASKLRPDLGH